MKRILFLAPDYYPTVGGYANAITNITSHLATSGKYEIHVLTQVQNKGKELELKNLYIHRFKNDIRILKGLNLIIYSIRRNIAINELFKKYKFDFILVETFELAKLSLKIIRKSRLKPNQIAVRIHGCTETELFAFSSKFHKEFEKAKLLASYSRTIFVTTPYYIDFFKNYYCNNDIYLSNKNFGILPNFPTLVRENPNGNGKESSDFTFEEDKLYFLTLGRLYGEGYIQKNFELIAYALYLLRKKNFELFKKINIIFIASTYNLANHLKSFENILINLGVRDRFLIYEHLPNTIIQDIQSRVCATILTSRFEGHSMFITEALSNGSPLILSRNTGLEFLVNENENGFLIDYDSPEDVANAIIKVANADINSLKEGSKTIFKNKFSAQRLIEVFDNYIDMFPNTLK